MTFEEIRARPGALVVNLLGDFSRSGGRELRLKSLVALGEDLGVSGPTMRVTLARLRERGWFEVRREGRESVYRLSAVGVLAIHEGAQRIHSPAPDAWAGEWSMVVSSVPEGDRHTRDELRRQLVWHGFGLLAPATWIRPRPGFDDILTATAELAAATLTTLTTRTSGLAADRALAAACWDLGPLGLDYEAYVRELRARMPAYRQAALDGRTALVARIGLVHSYRRLAWRDPRFPADLQPAGWQGDEARRLFGQAHALLAEGSADYYRLVAEVDGKPVSID
ncbi:PaaX family transcriptional regulator C-terminal domain-containing protein [Microbacterium betulae]|uniref:PaaX family transcriptional regulator C-terminal domain-containing protein n=1 Tax=Microbacterium betulae TaxID=2981139 RepID=A0AA97FG03_9MICO|nr:PaaX family transcriptional regulator C-terminal domain-containing protein [Microbacterium sp. AB]WOF22851.1 PaaX family transcriptional regulator C-terminal domain-containing protein [Microbacterium sp. AB]